MAMKNVAGFHSLDFFLNWRFSFLSGFGTKFRQNDLSTTVAGAVLEYRMPHLEVCDVLNTKEATRI